MKAVQLAVALRRVGRNRLDSLRQPSGEASVCLTCTCTCSGCPSVNALSLSPFTAPGLWGSLPLLRQCHRNLTKPNPTPSGLPQDLSPKWQHLPVSKLLACGRQMAVTLGSGPTYATVVVTRVGSPTVRHQPDSLTWVATRGDPGEHGPLERSAACRPTSCGASFLGL